MCFFFFCLFLPLWGKARTLKMVGVNHPQSSLLIQLAAEDLRRKGVRNLEMSLNGGAFAFVIPDLEKEKIDFTVSNVCEFDEFDEFGHGKSDLQFDLLGPFPKLTSRYQLAKHSGNNRTAPLQKMSDLDGEDLDWSFALDHRAFESKTWKNMKKFYPFFQNLTEDRLHIYNPGLLLRFLKSPFFKCDLALVDSQDGVLFEEGFEILEDNRGVFSSCATVFLLSKGFEKRFPFEFQTLKRLGEQITSEEMHRMRYLQTVKGFSLKEVSDLYFSKEGFFQSPDFWDRFPKKQNLFSFFLRNTHELWLHVAEQIRLVFASLFFVICFGLVLGVLASSFPFFAKFILAFASVFQTIPSFALFGLLIVFIPSSFWAVVVSLIFYSLLPVIRNTYTGFLDIHPDTIRASRAMGMTRWQILRLVRLPLALPHLMSGIRTSSIWIISIAPLGAIVGAGGLGEPILRGITSNNQNLIFFGAIPVAFSAIFLDRLLLFLEKKLLKIYHVKQ